MMRSIVDVMKRTPKWRFYLLLACLLLIVSELTAAEADAGSWMYYRSYFTDSVPGGPPHALVPNLQSRWTYRRPIRGTGYGFSVRGGYRYNRIYLRGGLSSDTTIIREDWFDVRGR
jgi:hypothetical protein